MRQDYCVEARAEDTGCSDERTVNKALEGHAALYLQTGQHD